ncbi:hypothetical protein WMY93_031746 [Mugilogobius chulae]|uniref:Uncharacterized protein n=1 Tax=Mugilogobius chulae TaxID=88201 RepID=A0AAW0MH79_9GOBI
MQSLQASLQNIASATCSAPLTPRQPHSHQTHVSRLLAEVAKPVQTGDSQLGRVVQPENHSGYSTKALFGAWITGLAAGVIGLALVLFVKKRLKGARGKDLQIREYTFPT